ncbi:class I SAM-dependent methyltransferase [Enterococcus sp. DIV2381]|uniref:class I SAM-dependent methyltransferase n=1 Tax=unclassified Enterococcus TaxID=2608891 RepID=UPI003D285624
MIETLLSKPTLYQQTKGAFWDDRHISKQMLQAHLDPEFEGASRKAQFIDESVRWINQMLKPEDYPTLLDIGCGPGIYAEKFSQLGYQVTGLDFSKRSISYGRKSAESQHLPITYHYADYLKMDLGKQYDIITMIYCDFGALAMSDRKKLLEKIYQHLKPTGKVLLDVFSMASYQLFEEKQVWDTCPDGGFWTAEPHVALQYNTKYNERVTLEQTTILTANEFKNYYLWMTYFTKETLQAEMAASGFAVCGFFGDVKGTDYEEDSPTLAVLLEKKG